MTDTKAKIWVRKDGKIAEITAVSDDIVMDVYINKRSLLKHYYRIIKYLLFTKKQEVKSKEELAKSIHTFIDEYYDAEKAYSIKEKVLEDLELKHKNDKSHIYYVG